MIRVGFIPKRAEYGSINLSSQAILSARKELYALGVDIALDHERDVDLLCVHKVHLHGKLSHLLESNTPLIIDDDRDSARVSNSVRTWAKAGFCCGVLKTHIYRPRWIYMRDTERVQINTDLLELGPGYGCFGRLDELKQNEPDWDAERPIDVHFAGTVEYRGYQEYQNKAFLTTQHRKQCADAVEALADHGFNVRVVRGRTLSRADYWKELRQSKICVSPYGWAETCHRDVEAILCGCELVKPPCVHIDTLPQLYGMRDNFTEVDEGFDLLCSIAGELTRDWLKRIIHRRTMFSYVRMCGDAGVVAAHMAEVFHRCLERAK